MTMMYNLLEVVKWKIDKLVASSGARAEDEQQVVASLNNPACGTS